MMALVGTLTFNFSVVLPLFIERTRHGSDASFTILDSVLSVGSPTGALAAAHPADHHDPPRRRRVGRVGCRHAHLRGRAHASPTVKAVQARTAEMEVA